MQSSQEVNTPLEQCMAQQVIKQLKALLVYSKSKSL